MENIVIIVKTSYRWSSSCKQNFNALLFPLHMVIYHQVDIQTNRFFLVIIYIVFLSTFHPLILQVGFLRPMALTLASSLSGYVPITRSPVK